MKISFNLYALALTFTLALVFTTVSASPVPALVGNTSEKEIVGIVYLVRDVTH